MQWDLLSEGWEQAGALSRFDLFRPRQRGGMPGSKRRGADLVLNEAKSPSPRALSRTCAAAVGAALLLRPARAFAMHLAEGILPPGWAAAWWLAAIPVLAAASARLARRAEASPLYKPFVAMIAATVFVLSCMPIPVPVVGTCSHPCGTGLAAVLLGPAMAVVVAFVALLLQALLLAHGGLSTLGADLWSMGIVGGFAGWLAWRALLRCGASRPAAAFAAGVASDWATYATTALQIGLGLHGDRTVGQVFRAVLIAFVPTQLPIGLFEGALSACAVAFLIRRRPALLELFANPPLSLAPEAAP